MKSRKLILSTFAAGILLLFLQSCSPRFASSRHAATGILPGDNVFGTVPDTATRINSIEIPEIKNKPGDVPEAGSVRLTRESIIAEDLLETAKTYLGVPHCMGGTTFRCIDCSGFVMKVFEEYGISLPHNSQAQSKIGLVIKNRDELIRGDIVFFKESYRTSNYITHAGIYIGNNQFIHTSSGKGVTITSLDDSWWKDKFVHGTRVLE